MYTRRSDRTPHFDSNHHAITVPKSSRGYARVPDFHVLSPSRFNSSNQQVQPTLVTHLCDVAMVASAPLAKRATSSLRTYQA